MLRIDNLVFDAWGRRFFDSASVAIPAGAKVGLIGRNGVGKSTLFKLIKGEFIPQGGDIELPKRARIGSVDQEHPATPVSLLETILAADTRRDGLNARLETAAPEEIAEIYHELNAIDADRAPARAAEILSGLGFANDDLHRAMAEFSGGWRMAHGVGVLESIYLGIFPEDGARFPGRPASRHARRRRSPLEISAIRTARCPNGRATAAIMPCWAIC